jgi:hypothetical protein
VGYLPDVATGGGFAEIDPIGMAVVDVDPPGFDVPHHDARQARCIGNGRGAQNGFYVFLARWRTRNASARRGRFNAGLG